jgi:hypothetical protein
MGTIRIRMAWFRDLSRALHTMHCAHLIHRDIKPRNIVISDEGHAFLIDLGIASRSNNPSALVGEFAGTTRYMSPEQASSGRVAIDSPTDQYSLALVFLEAITGEPVREHFGNRVIKEILIENESRRDLELIGRAPTSLRPIFRKALQRDANRRFASCSVLADLINNWLERRPLRGARATRYERAAIVMRCYPVSTALAVMLIAAVSIWGLTLAWPVSAAVREKGQIDRQLAEGKSSHTILSRLASLAITSPNLKGLGSTIRQAVSAHASKRSMELVREQRFAVQHPQASSLHRSFARDAEVLFPFARDPDLLFHIAYSDLLGERKVQALARLERSRELLAKSPFLAQLHILLLSIAKRQSEAELLAQQRTPEQIYDEGLATCFEAFRLLFFIKYPCDLPQSKRADLQAMEGRLSALLEKGRELGLCRTLRARLRLVLLDFDGALGDASTLESEATTDAERAGCLGFIANAHAIWAGAENDQEKRGRHLRFSIDCMVKANRVVPECYSRVGRICRRNTSSERSIGTPLLSNPDNCV